MADTTNTLDQVVHNLVINVALQAALNAIVVAVPFLGYPVIKTVFFFLATQFSELLYGEMSKLIVFNVIGIKEAQNQKAYQDAVDQLGKALAVKNNVITEQDHAKIQAAQEKFKNTFNDLIRLRPL